MGSTHAADGTVLAYDVTGTGDGPAVVLVHGITENATTWDPIVERLATSHRVVTLDLRGHGRSGTADSYDLGAMAGDVVAVTNALALERPHLVGHSLGGAVVSAAGAALPVSSVVNVDQSLQLGDFKDQLVAFEPQLRDADAFPAVIEALFEIMNGDMISATEKARVGAARRPDQAVVLGVWELLLKAPSSEIVAVVDEALGGYRGLDVAYLSLFGIDPGDGYDDWIESRIAGAVTEVWAEHGHYPHLVDPDRFVARLRDFWG